jgi:hypothetical protein
MTPLAGGTPVDEESQAAVAKAAEVERFEGDDRFVVVFHMNEA